MKTILGKLVGVVFLLAGAFFVLAGGMRFFAVSMVLADGRVNEVPGGTLATLLLQSVVLLLISFWALQRGWGRVRGPSGAATAEERFASTPSPVVSPPPPPPPVPAPVAPRIAPAPAHREIEPVPVRAVELVLTLAHRGQVVVMLPGSGEITVGRGRDSRIVVASKFVSRAHAKVIWESGASPRVVNLSSLGTTLRATGDATVRSCDPELPLEGEGMIALSADYAEAVATGDVISFAISSR